MAPGWGETADPPRPRAWNRWLPSLIFLALYLAAAVPMILAGARTEGRIQGDQDDYHLVVIQRFLDQWPAVDLTDYPSVTTPGYHLFVAAAAAAVGENMVVMRCAGAVFTVALLVLWGWAVSRGQSWLGAVALGLPLVTSLYVFPAGVWLLPDNAGWLPVLALLLIAFDVRRWRLVVSLSLPLLVLLVLVRQSHVWVAAPLVVAALWRPGADLRLGRAAARRVGAIILAGLPSVLVLAAFVTTWGGLAPPTFDEGHPFAPAGPNFAVPAMFFATSAWIGGFFVGYWWPHIPRGRGSVVVLAAGGLCGFLAGVLPETTVSLAEGRYGGLWALGRYLIFADRSLVVLAASVLGGVVLAAQLLACRPRDRAIAGAALAAFVVVQSANALAFQRYYEPFILILLGLCCARMPRAGSSIGAGVPAWARVGPVVLAILLAALTVRTLN